MADPKTLSHELLILAFETAVCNRQRAALIGTPEALDECENRVREMRSEILSRMQGADTADSSQ